MQGIFQSKTLANAFGCFALFNPYFVKLYRRTIHIHFFLTIQRMNLSLLHAAGNSALLAAGTSRVTVGDVLNKTGDVAAVPV
jgi:hypothetical protein